LLWRIWRILTVHHRVEGRTGRSAGGPETRSLAAMTSVEGRGFHVLVRGGLLSIESKCELKANIFERKLSGWGNRWHCREETMDHIKIML
jgi:hypothetical protein